MKYYDIKNNPKKVDIDMGERIRLLSNEIYILAAGNHFCFSDHTISKMKSLIKTIKNYVLKENEHKMKIKCPICGKELINLNPIIHNSTYEFWCDNCEIDITIGTDKKI